jgi:hypothetical protein
VATSAPGARRRRRPEDVKAAGFATDPAPTKPLSAVARKAAADVALNYLAHARTAKYGALSEGYTVAYREGILEFRCKGPGNPGSDLCNGAGWSAWQRGYGS